MLVEVKKKYWTIFPCDEYVSTGEGSMCRPWHGVVTKILPYGDVQLCHYDEKDVPDDDSNARATVPAHLLFQDEKEAWAAYRRYLGDQSDGILREILFCDDKLNSL